MLDQENQQDMRRISSYSYESSGGESTIRGISPFNYGSNGSSFSFDGFDKLPDDLESVFSDDNGNKKSQAELSAKECQDLMRNGTKVLKISFLENGKKNISKKTLLLDEDKTSIRYQPTKKGMAFKNEVEKDPLRHYPWLDEAFKNVDKDSNGALTFDETIKILRRLNIGFTTEDIKEKFQRCNVDGDTSMKRGQLTRNEFAEFFQYFLYHPTVRQLFNKYSDNSESLTLQTFKNFMDNEQLLTSVAFRDVQDLFNEFSDGNSDYLSYQDFQRMLLSPSNSLVKQDHANICQDMTQPLSHYFINTSHNTYLAADQWKGPSSVDAYVNALKKGCRCVELDCWNGDDGEPIIYHGHTLTSKILFKDVIQAVNEHAFLYSDYPLILSFENHCNPDQQKKMAHYLKEILGDKLYTEPVSVERKALPSPEELKGKILCKGKKLPLIIEEMSELDEETSYCVSDEDESGDAFESIKEDPTLAQRYHVEIKGTEISVSIKEDPNDTSTLSRKSTDTKEKSDEEKNFPTYHVEIEGSMATVSTEEDPNDTFTLSEKSISITEEPNEGENFPTYHVEIEGSMATVSTEEDPNDTFTLSEKSINITEKPNEGENFPTYHVEIGGSVGSISTDEDTNDTSTLSRKSTDTIGKSNKEKILEQPEVAQTNHVEREGPAASSPVKEDPNDTLTLSKKSTDTIGKPNKKKKCTQKLSPAFSKLVNYIQSVHYCGLQEALDGQEYYKMSSFAEAKFIKLAKSKPLLFNKFNGKFLTRTYPAGKRVDSSNYNPVLGWVVGCQLVALNFQTNGQMMDINKGMFQLNGGCGYVLKPEFMLKDTFTYNAEKPEENVGIEPAHVKLTVISGHLFPKNKQNSTSISDPYVSVSVHGVKEDTTTGKMRTKTIKDNGFNPYWQEEFQFKLHVPDLALIRFVVYDDVVGRDDIIGQCTIPFRAANKGYRSVKLLDKAGKELPYASLFVHIENMLAQKEIAPLHRTECKFELKQRPLSVTITFDENGTHAEVEQQDKLFTKILNKDENEEGVEKINNLEDISKEHNGCLDRHEIF